MADAPRPAVETSPKGTGCQDPKARAALESYWNELHPTEQQLAYLVFQSRRFDAVIRAVEGLYQGRDLHVLDVGAGSGALSVALRARLGGTYDLTDYLEPDEATRKALSARGISAYLHCDLASRDPFAGLRPGYDLVLFVEVLEHLLVNPVPLLRRMGHLARPGGFLLVTTPNQARLRNRLRLALGRSIREEGAFPDGDAPTFGHVQEYALGELLDLLRRAGLTPRTSRVVQNYPTLRPTAGQRAGRRLLGGGLAHRLRLGDEMVVLAQRPGG